MIFLSKFSYKYARYIFYRKLLSGISNKTYAILIGFIINKINIMGCDFSMLVKQDFTQKITDLENREKMIEKKQQKMQHMLTELKEIKIPDINLKLITDTLCSELKKLEEIIEDIELSQEISNNSSLSISKSIEKMKEIDNLPPLGINNRKSIKKNKNASSVKEQSLNSDRKLNTAESILENPEIMALINKNRNHFLKKVEI